MSGFKIIGESKNGNDWALFKLNKSINLSSEKKFNNVGNKVKVTQKDVIKPKVIIHPKSITGLISLKINDKNAHMVVRTV